MQGKGYLGSAVGSPNLCTIALNPNDNGSFNRLQAFRDRQTLARLTWVRFLIGLLLKLLWDKA